MAIALSHGGTNIYTSPELSAEVLVGTIEGVVTIHRSGAEWRPVHTGLETCHISAIVIEKQSGLVGVGGPRPIDRPLLRAGRGYRARGAFLPRGPPGEDGDLLRLFDRRRDGRPKVGGGRRSLRPLDPQCVRFVSDSPTEPHAGGPRLRALRQRLPWDHPHRPSTSGAAGGVPEGDAPGHLAHEPVAARGRRVPGKRSGLGGFAEVRRGQDPLSARGAERLRPRPQRQLLSDRVRGLAPRRRHRCENTELPHRPFHEYLLDNCGWGFLRDPFGVELRRGQPRYVGE